MTALILPWQKRGRSILPSARAALRPTPVGNQARGRERYRLTPVNKPDVPPHYHVEQTQIGFIEERGIDPVYRHRTPVSGQQVMTASVAKGLLPCEVVECDWFLNGKEGFDEGMPFKHPQGVECGDERGCTDDNCPCPQRVIEWPDGVASGHITACVYCDGRWKAALGRNQGPADTRRVTFDEYFYRFDEGADALVTILKHGL